MMALMMAAMVGAAQPAPDLDAFFEKLAERRDAIETMQARIVQENILSDDTLRSEGTLLYARPRRLVFRYTDPDQVFLLDGLRSYEYNAEDAQVAITDFSDDPATEALFLGFEGDPQRLKEAYDLVLFEPEPGDCAAHGIELRPKDSEDDLAIFQVLRLYLRDPDYLPCRVHLVNDAESQVVIRVKSTVVNGPLDAEATQIALPEGTTIVDNDRGAALSGPGVTLLPEAPAGAPEEVGEPATP